MPTAFVSVGSNVDRERNVARVLELLRERFGEVETSSVYETEPVGFEGDPFFNLVVAFECDAEPRALVAELHELESRCGRRRDEARYGPRTMDLDLLLLDDCVVEDDDIVLPREDLGAHAFVLCPLAEIAGERRHPVSGDTLGAMWARARGGARPPRKVNFPTGEDTRN